MKLQSSSLAAIAILNHPALITCVPTGAGTGHHGRPPRPGPYQPGQPITSTVDLGYAKYEGLSLDAGVNQWLGIQFGKPPVGDLRWRAPQEPDVNRTVQQATEFKPTCLGYWASELSPTVNEDCLYLDVFAPSNATTESNLPVWFFIQGGGYAGDLDENFNFTEVIERSGYGMVAVQINYRVGAFGFLASEKVREDGDLNVGLLDQRK